MLYSDLIKFSHFPKFIFVLLDDWSFFWFFVLVIVIVEYFCIIIKSSPLSIFEVLKSFVIWDLIYSRTFSSSSLFDVLLILQRIFSVPEKVISLFVKDCASIIVSVEYSSEIIVISLFVKDCSSIIVSVEYSSEIFISSDIL